MLMPVSNGVITCPVDQTSKRAGRRFWRPALLVASFAAIASLAGCPVTPPATDDDTSRIDVVFDRTGSLLRDSIFQNMTQASTIVGDDSSNRPFCAFVSLNLNNIDDDENVTRVVLNLTAIVANGDPFGDFGTITVDHVNVVSGISASDYTGGTIQAAIATIQSFPTGTQQPVTIDVTSQVNADRTAGRPISSFRLRFDAAPSADGLPDNVLISTSADDANQRPSGTITVRRTLQ